MQQCAILTMDCLDDFEAYDYLLDQPMAKLGWENTLVSWHDESVNWHDFDVVLIRTPWDYQIDAEKFLNVLEAIEQSPAKLENSLAIVRWNINKKYLQELEAKGVTIVPTLWQETYLGLDLLDCFKHFNTSQIVIKPCVSANADNTFWLTTDNYQNYNDELATVFAKQDFMVQPFMESVINEGEFSCFYFDGKYSHSILKTPKENDFRVQEEHGGRLTAIEPEVQLAKQAQHAIDQLNEIPMYARVDFVRCGNEFAMMEAELIEPSLYFNMDAKSAQRFAHAFAEKMKRS
ncbi:RimK family alpha-L-glutamate ligase [Colwelliaceae bacterium BS250]